MGFINAIQSGEPLPIVASGLRLATTIDRLTTTNGQLAFPELADAAGAVSGVMVIFSLERAIQSGDVFGALGSAAQLGSYAANGLSQAALSDAITAIQAGSENGAAALAFTANAELAKALGNVAAVFNLDGSLARGDMVGALASAAYFIPGYGPIISVGIQILNAIFGGGGGSSQPPEGTVILAYGANGQATTYIAYDQGGGGTVLGILNNLVSAAQSAGYHLEPGRLGAQIGTSWNTFQMWARTGTTGNTVMQNFGGNTAAIGPAFFNLVTANDPKNLT